MASVFLFGSRVRADARGGDIDLIALSRMPLEQEKVAIADTEGRWKVMLDPLTACADPRTLLISSTHSQQPITIDDVLVGQVVVSCPGVSRPKAVRYAWADNPAANLYNRDGLPASPFRADVM